MLADYEFKVQENLSNQRKFAHTQLVIQKKTGDTFILKSAPITQEDTCNILRQESNFKFDNINLQSSLKIWEEENCIFLIKSYLKGEVLSDYYKKLKGRSRKVFIIRFLHKLSVLIEDLHSQGIVHLDLKPSNVIVHQNGDEFEVGIIDFGLAWKLQELQTRKRKSYYPFGRSAPELILNVQKLFQPATDYYAIGVLIYELLEGKLPFNHPHPIQSINLQLNLKLPKLGWKARKFQGIVDKLCAKEAFRIPPNQMSYEEQFKVLENGIRGRYRDLSELRKDLENI